MKNFISTIVAFLLFTLFCNVTHAEKHGLIIAIGDYPEDGKWMDISSQNDVDLVRSALAHMAFPEENIYQISDAEATQAGIIAAFERLAENVAEGDIVYIHFSGHGQQVMDNNGDEIDNLDEAIVPYDSPMLFSPGVYEGERLIRDDQLNALTAAIRRRCGPSGQVILVLDSCHSGTGTRGMAKARGTTTIMAPASFKADRMTGETTMGITNTDEEGIAPMASFFGASPRELNYETLDDQSRPVGSLSYAISTALASMKEAYSFEELFDHVKTKMKVLAPRQNPQWEGPRGVVILGGEKLPGQDRYSVSKWTTDTELISEVGTIASIYNGCKVEVVTSANNVLTTGTVTRAGLTSSIITIEPTDIARDELLYVRVTEAAFPPMTVRIFHDLDNHHLWSQTLSETGQLPIYEPVTANADLYMTTCDDEALQVAMGDGTIIGVIPYNQVDPSLHKRSINTVLRQFLQGKFLRSFDNPGSAFDFELELVVVDCNSGQQTSTPTDLVLPIGTCVQMIVTNHGVQGGYFSILDIQPDNLINVVVPDVVNGRTATEYYLKAGASFTTATPIEIAQPAGSETLKLLASREPLDLAGIIATKGNNRRGTDVGSSFEQYMAASYKTSTRGAKVRKKAGEDIGVSTVFFTIK